MLKLYIYERLPNQADSKLLRLFLSENEFEGKIFQSVRTQPFKEMVEFVTDVREAHYILLAHEYYFIKHEAEYFNRLNSFSNTHKKKVIVFDYGDVVDEVHVENSIILRTAGYRSKLKPNEIIIPPFVEELVPSSEVAYITNKNDKPIVGFVGMVHFPNLLQEFKYQARKLNHLRKVFLSKSTKAELQGIYFRRIVVRVLKASQACVTNFIIRKSFSAHEKTIVGDPKQIRQEYIDTILNSDLNVVVRGDGNYSLRFFEVLSAGRIPLFIDTETPLPFESEIDYDQFMIRVSYENMSQAGDYVAQFWKSVTVEDLVEKQKLARTIFETKLRPDVFYSLLFTRLAEQAG